MAMGDSKPSFFKRLSTRRSFRQSVALSPASDIQRKIKEIEAALEEAEEKLFFYQIVFPDATKELVQIKVELELCDKLIHNYKNWHHQLDEMYPKVKPKHAEIQQRFLSDKVAALQLRKHDLDDKKKQLETPVVKPAAAKPKTAPVRKVPVTRIHHHEYQKIFITHAPMQPNLKFMTECSQHLKGIKQAFSGWFNPDRLVKQLFSITQKARGNIKKVFPQQFVGPHEATAICHDTFILLFRQLKKRELKNFYNYFTSKTFKTFLNSLDYFASNPDDLNIFIVKNRRDRASMDAQQSEVMTRINTLTEFLRKGLLLALQVVMSEWGLNYQGLHSEISYDVTVKDTNSKSKKYIEYFVKDYYSITGFIDPAAKPNKMVTEVLPHSSSPQLSLA